MELGLEINFIFDKVEFSEEIIKLKKSYNFDIRNGFGLVMSGKHWSEIEDSNRLLTLIENELELDLSLLDYWNEKTFEKNIEINNLIQLLLQLKIKIRKDPKYYKKINNSFTNSENYLKDKLLLDIEYLITYFNLYVICGATKVKYETE